MFPKMHSPEPGLDLGTSSPTSSLPPSREAADPGQGPLLQSRKTWEQEVVRTAS